MIAADIMSTPVIAVTPDTPVAEVARLLLEKRISAVPVLVDGRPVGIVSEGDLLRQASPAPPRKPSWLELLFASDMLAAEYIHSHARTAGQVMTHKVITVMEDAYISDIVDILEGKRIKRVPVVDIGGRVVGIISRSNLLHGLAARTTAPASGDSDDARIRHAFLAEILAQDWAPMPDEGNVVVNDGVVHLWGVVRSAEVREAMVLAAMNIAGVKKVEDHMQARVADDGINWGSWPVPGF